MVEPGEYLLLAEEPGVERRGHWPPSPPDRLDGNPPAQWFLHGLVDDSHPPDRQFPDDPEVAQPVRGTIVDLRIARQGEDLARRDHRAELLRQVGISLGIAADDGIRIRILLEVGQEVDDGPIIGAVGRHRIVHGSSPSSPHDSDSRQSARKRRLAR
jgi:hypothetical protein